MLWSQPVKYGLQKIIENGLYFSHKYKREDFHLAQTHHKLHGLCSQIFLVEYFWRFPELSSIIMLLELPLNSDILQIIRIMNWLQTKGGLDAMSNEISDIGIFKITSTGPMSFWGGGGVPHLHPLVSCLFWEVLHPIILPLVPCPFPEG